MSNALLRNSAELCLCHCIRLYQRDRHEYTCSLRCPLRRKSPLGSYAIPSCGARVTAGGPTSRRVRPVLLPSNLSEPDILPSVTRPVSEEVAHYQSLPFTHYALCQLPLSPPVPRGEYRISTRGGRPLMDWCLNAIV